MARIPSLKRLLQEDFKDQPWIGPLLQSLNQYMETGVAALSRGLTLADNFACEVRDVTLDGTFPTKVQLSRVPRPPLVLKGNLRRTDGSAVTLTGAVDFTWSYTETGIQIDSLVGVTPTGAAKYVLTLICLAG